MLNWVKAHVRRSSRAFGYDIVPLRSVKERDFAIHLGQLFRLHSIDCVFDVGANIGQYRDFLRNDVCYDGHIVSFEPIARNFEVLHERSKLDNRWIVTGCALGRAAGSMQLNVMKSDQFSSFLAPNNSSVPAYSGLNETASTSLVDVQTLDNVFHVHKSRLKFQRPYIKLDTQGFDIEVLRGGESILPMVCALQTEASVIPVYDGMPNYQESINYLYARGFEVSGMYPVSRDASLRLVEFDCVMVNGNIASSRR